MFSRRRLFFDKTGKKGARPPFVLWWGRKEKTGLELEKLRIEMGFTPVTIEDGIYPEPLKRDEHKHYVLGDAVLLKTSYGNFRDKVMTDRRRADAHFDARLKDFKARTRESGAELSDDELDSLLGIRYAMDAINFEAYNFFWRKIRKWLILDLS